MVKTGCANIMVFCYNANDRTAENKIPNGMSFELLFMTQRPIIFPTPFLITQKRF